MKKIVLIGSGNVASHLGKALFNSGHNILQVISQTAKNAKSLASQLDADWDTDISRINKSDLTIVSINDDITIQVIKKLEVNNFAHTSGSVTTREGGVLYPLQTFTKKIPVDMQTVPFCIWSENKDMQELLFEIASSISNRVYRVNNKQRENLHLSAVFASNFTNHMYLIAEKILNGSDLDFEIIKPLITETASKVSKASPKICQTGPAKRRDLSVLKKQLDSIDDKDIKSLYSLITNQILSL